MLDIKDTPGGTGGQLNLFHMVVICLSFALTLGVWQYSVAQVEKRNGLRFEAARDRALGLISDRMTKYEDALWSGVAAIESHGGDIAHADWRIFSENLRIDERYPGINGIGVIHFHTAETLPDYLAIQQNERPGFEIYPGHDLDIFMPITFIEPEGINAAAIGLDVAHETNRRTAALASRDTGTAQISGPIVLVQDAGQTSGFLFYAPFYRGGAQPDVASRRATFAGAVYAPFVVHKLMEGLLAKELRGVRFSIHDAGELIYDEHSADDPFIDPDPMFSEVVTLDLYGRTWVLDMRSDLAFRFENSNEKPTIILAAGLVIEILIVSLLILMSRANKRAVDYANDVTLALRAEKSKLVVANAELSGKNEALERFAYVASHDLKTPIRGISGLTDMLQEDLEDYLSSPNANPDVDRNLARIQERVRRMEKLTRGILDVTRVEWLEDAEDPVKLDDIVAALRLDFGLSDEQLHLEGVAGKITCDQTNFHSVIENLVGNAIKYHHGPSDVRVVIKADIIGDRMRVSVSDNGPGIDPKYHARIFEVFQTLGADGAGDSTGVGLSIVRRAVERHGGEVTVVSAPGEGASFSFDWPLCPSRRGAASLDEAA